MSRVVVKVGSASIAPPEGGIDPELLEGVVKSVSAARRDGTEVILVSSGAIAAGLPLLGMTQRPSGIEDLQVLAAVGQTVLMQSYANAFGKEGFVTGQVLLTSADFSQRSHYLNARNAIERMLELGIVPVVNENDTVATDEIRFGDNDRLGALVAQLVGASLYLILTDTEGVFTSDPKLDREATLLEEVKAFDEEMEKIAGGTGSMLGSGGMLSKLLATRMVAWTGIRAVIAYAHAPDVVRVALAGQRVGTEVKPHYPPLPARKAWIAFGAFPEGKIVVDSGARRALEQKGASLLPVGVRKVEGDFDVGSAVEIADESGAVFGKGITRLSASQLIEVAGKRTSDLGGSGVAEVVHRDDMVILPNI
ncbi:MAG: glutamate 5-kinase [Acidimicrobiia bacterium]